MLTLLSEIRYWTTHDDICIKDTDYGAYKYYERKDALLSISSRSKREYAEKRDYLWNLTNKRPAKLKDKLKELEEQIVQNRVVYCKWTDTDVLKLMLNTGLIINICVKKHTGDIHKISFDKYLIGKLQSECVSDVLFTRANVLCTYNDNQMTVVQLTKSTTMMYENDEKLHRFEPRIQVNELAGPVGRKLDRKMSCNVNGDKLLVWWRCTRDEVYPWSPLVKDQDRANIHVYYLAGTKLELLCYRRTEFDPVGVTFSSTEANVVNCVEQKVSRKGVVTVETCTYEIVKGKLHQLLITSIPLQTQVCCHAFSPDNEKLLLGCIDGSVVLFDQRRTVTHLVKAAFIPTLASWHADGAVILVANERCQVQCFDVSLANMKCRTMSSSASLCEDTTNVLDLGSYLHNTSSTLVQMAWSRRRGTLTSRYVHQDALLVLVLERGPLTCVRLVASTTTDGCCTPEVLVAGYMAHRQVDRAIGILLSLNWDLHGAKCLNGLHTIIGWLMKQPLTPETESQMQRALGCYYAPLQPISEQIQSEFGEQVKDMTRKFFHLLVRYGMYEKAFCLAIDVNDYDLFMDLYYCAQQQQPPPPPLDGGGGVAVSNNGDMADAALTRAKELISRSNSSNASHNTEQHSVCSHSSCSQCSDDDDEEENNSVTNEEGQRRQHDNNTSWLLNACGSGCGADVSLSVVVPPPPLPIPILPTLCPSPMLAPPPPPLPFITQPAAVLFRHNNTITMSRNKHPTSTLMFHNTTNTSEPQQQQQPLPVTSRTTLDTTATVGILKPRLISMSNPSAFKSVMDKHSPNSRQIIQHRTISMNIPSVMSSGGETFKLSVPLQHSSVVNNHSSTSTSTCNNNTSTKTNNEKNVKFSETVTAFIVPEMNRSEKVCGVKERNRRSSNHRYLTDPKQELADSLPLCHPHDDYLKDFTPITNNTDDEETVVGTTKIKVVHFGMV